MATTSTETDKRRGRIRIEPGTKRVRAYLDGERRLLKRPSPAPFRAQPPNRSQTGPVRSIRRAATKATKVVNDQ
jgi:hypothetical protein